MAERIAEINPQADVRIHKCFFLPENAEEFPFDEYDYIVDAVDTVTAKIALCNEGTGNANSDYQQHGCGQQVRRQPV